MLVGILSDSHGRADPVRAAVALFDRLGVKHLIHCGDVGGVEVFDELVGRPITFVWGNTDMPGGGLLSYLHSVKIGVPDGARVTLDGKSFAVFHGHEPG
jgi:predicted phosphodiesterase